MKIFISWSGDHSRQVAEALRSWLPDVVAYFEPWLSSEDVEKGARWTVDLATELADTQVGIVCLTPDNLDAPWILYESGALARALAGTAVCTYLHGVKPTDVTGPLVQFQATEATRDDTYRMLQALNKLLGDHQMQEDRLARVFDRSWPDLARALEAASARPPSTPGRTERQLIEEILGLVRQDSKASAGASLRGRSSLLDLDALMDDLSSGRLTAELTREPNGSNSADWAPVQPEPWPGPLDGRWSSRWAERNDDSGALGPWNTGTAVLLQHGAATVIHASDVWGDYLILAGQGPDGVLLGRYYNVAQVRVSSPWRGVVVSPDRIDGAWERGPWDFRRPGPPVA